MGLYSDLKTKVQAALEDVLLTQNITDPLVIFKYQNAPEPDGVYCALYVIDIQDSGRSTKSIFLDDVEDNEDVGRHYAQQHYTAVIQCTFVGDGSGDLAYAMKQALMNSILANECFLKQGVSFRSATRVRDNHQLRETQWVESFNFDITVGYSVQTTEDMNWVEFITVNGTQIPYN